MRMRIGSIVTFAVVLSAAAVLAGAAPASVASGSLPWQDGWDGSGALDLAQSSVLWSQTSNASLDATYTFVGADPNAQYTVGIALLYAAQSDCLPAFGQFGLGPCYDVTRQGYTSWEDDTNGVNPAGVGTLATDGAGDGSLTVHFTGIAPGTYMLKFYARAGVGGGSIEFQAPGPFSQTLDLTFAALPSSKDQCKDGAWQTFGVFGNQGDCVSFVATGGKNPPGGR